MECNEQAYKFEPIKEAETVIFDSVLETGIDLAEVSIDLLCEDSILRDIPILGTVFKLGKAVFSISRRMYIKKILIFAQEMQKGNVDKEILQKHKERLLADPKLYNSELETIVEYINRQVGYEKSKYYARTYMLYLNQEIKYEEFILFFEIIDQMFLTDIDTLKEIYEKNTLNTEDNYSAFPCKRLSNCGLIDFYNGMAVQDPDSGAAILAQITYIGKYFGGNIYCF